jgi:glutathione peroxidase
MIKTVSLCVFALFSLALAAFNKSADNSRANKSFYDFTANSIDGKKIDFKNYKGKKVLVVNVASKCGYTSQYKELEKLHKEFGDKVIVLGFPANNFGRQEPGTNQEIKTFCTSNYGVSFQMFEKVSVTGNDQHELFKWLSTKELNGKIDKSPSWNFCKYLIDENGQVVAFFPSSTKPLSDDIVSLLK